MIQTLLNQGLVTKAPTRDKQWLSARLVSRMILAFFQHAMQHGVHDWSTVINGSLSLALIAATGCRASDVARGERTGMSSDEELAYLKYEDIGLKIEDVSKDKDGDYLDMHLKAEFVLRYTKGLKDNPGQNHTVQFEHKIEGGEIRNVNDPLKLLVIQALRTGAVSEKTVTDLVINTSSRADKTVQWAHPERPVLCAQDRGVLVPDRPADTRHIRRYLQEAAELCNMTEDIRPHNIRRGVAAGSARVPTSMNADAARLQLGHSVATYTRGVTNEYIGPIDSNYHQRLDLPDSSFGIRAMEVNKVPQYTHKRLRHDDVEARILANEQTRHEKDAESLQMSNVPIDKRRRVEHTRAQRSITRRSTNAETLMTETTSTTNPNLTIVIDDVHESGTKIRDPNATPSTAGVTPDDPFMIEDDGDEEDQELSRPCEFLSDILYVKVETDEVQSIIDNGNIVDRDTERETKTIIDKLRTTSDDTTMHAIESSDLISSSTFEFLDHFSRRNDYQTTTRQQREMSHLEGGSRDKPSKKMFECKFKFRGCESTRPSWLQIGEHEAEYRRREDRIQYRQKCEAEGCPCEGKTFITSSTTSGLSGATIDHYCEARWTPKQCEKGGSPRCGDVFASYKKFHAHNRSWHTDG